MTMATPMSKVPIIGTFAEEQSKQTKQEHIRAVQGATQLANSQKMKLEDAVATNEQSNGVESNGLYNQARQQESAQESKSMNKLDTFA